LKKIGVEEQKTNFTIVMNYTNSGFMAGKSSFPLIKEGSAGQKIYFIIIDLFLQCFGKKCI